MLVTAVLQFIAMLSLAGCLYNPWVSSCMEMRWMHVEKQWHCIIVDGTSTSKMVLVLIYHAKGARKLEMYQALKFTIADEFE